MSRIVGSMGIVVPRVELRLNFQKFAIYLIRSHPTIDAASIFTNLMTFSLNSLNQLKVLVSIDLAEYVISNYKFYLILNWGNRTELARFNFALR